MSVAIMPAALELGWTPGVQGLVQSSFLWGYMATQLLGGTMADVLGGRRTMLVSLAWFGAATALTPLAAGFPGVAAMMLARFLVGLGQGLTLPSMSSLVAGLPENKRSRGLGTAFAGFHSGNIAGLLLSPLILSVAGWRAIFIAFGVLAVPVSLLWAGAVPSTARDALPVVRGKSSSGGLSSARALRALLSHPPTWAIIVANFVNHWGYFIYLGWMPSYFHTQLSLSITASSVLSLLPWAVMALGSSASGWIADGLIMKGVPVTRVRKFLQTASFLGPAGALLVLQGTRSSAIVSMTCFIAALGLQSLGQAAFVANMSDIAPKHAGRLFGLSNTFGSLAGIVGVAFAGFAVQATGNFSLVFRVSAALYVCGAALYLALASSDRLEGLEAL
jgi:ACS family sodium-dependent inorganic phosphate cotransporter/ACS family sodium-dependent inorganic phosphate cotransporter-like MFS transporter 9